MRVWKKIVANACLIYQISGYYRVDGTKATAEELGRMFSVMEQNGLLKPARILTGTVTASDITSSRPKVDIQVSYLAQRLCPSSPVL